MKKFFMLACATVVSLGVSAQLISSNTISQVQEESNNYARFDVSYNSFDTDDITDDALSGISLGWTKGISVSTQLPLFVEVGMGLTYAWGTEEVELYGDSYDFDHSFMSLSVPVSLTYMYEISDGIRIAPYLGLFLRGNLLGQTTFDDEDMDWFDDEEGLEAKRLSYGYQLGVGVEFNKLRLGLEYANDMNEIVEECKASNFKLSVGFLF